MGLADWFHTFCDNIKVQNGATISLRYGNITKRLNTDSRWAPTADTQLSMAQATWT